MEIIIQDNLVLTLGRLAKEVNITPEQYIQNYMEAHLFSQYKAELVDVINRQTIDNLEIMKSIALPAIKVVEDKIAKEKEDAVLLLKQEQGIIEKERLLVNPTNG